MEDSYRHKGMRRRLLEALRDKGIQNERILEAIYRIPRHFFMEKAFVEWAYQDKPFPIGEGQTISQPYTVAYQTSLLNVETRQKVLEIGTGSGYQSSILAILGARVYTIERQEALYHKASHIFDVLNLKGIHSFFGDGMKGLLEYAPFDRILVTAGAKEVPKDLLEQLAVGGILVIPVGDEKQQEMFRIKRTATDHYEYELYDKFRFVPLLSGKKYMH